MGGGGCVGVRYNCPQADGSVLLVGHSSGGHLGMGRTGLAGDTVVGTVIDTGDKPCPAGGDRSIRPGS